MLAPIGTQEVWASGVTYRRRRDARATLAAGDEVAITMSDVGTLRNKVELA